MSRLLARPTNPKCDNDTNQTPKALGETRTLEDGVLQYKNPVTGNWQNAVHLQDIRQNIIDQADPANYTYKKFDGNAHGKDPTNVTSYIPGDKDLGSERPNRADIVFKIFPVDPRPKPPTGYMTDCHGRIVLDSFDHGIRGFPSTEVPSILSSELEGVDIETYQRRNRNIKNYDLQARMPNGYYTGKNGQKYHPGPPRKGTISQRAQRFRTKAACIEWGKREGTHYKNAKILSLIPASCKDPAANSTKAFRDLTKAERKEVSAQNKGRKKWQKRTKKEKDEEEQEQHADAEATEEKAEGRSDHGVNDQILHLIDDEDEAELFEEERGEAREELKYGLEDFMEEARRPGMTTKRKANSDSDATAQTDKPTSKSAKTIHDSTPSVPRHSLSSSPQTTQSQTIVPSNFATSEDAVTPGDPSQDYRGWSPYTPIYDMKDQTGIDFNIALGDHRFIAPNGHVTTVYGNTLGAAWEIARAADSNCYRSADEREQYPPVGVGSPKGYVTQCRRLEKDGEESWMGAGPEVLMCQLHAQTQGSGEGRSEDSDDMILERTLCDWVAAEDRSKTEAIVVREAGFEA